MTDHRGVSIVRWPEPGPLAGGGPETLLAAYHLRTQAEKGEGVAGVDDLPERYRAEVLDPRAAFLDDVVLLALSGDTAVGCLVLTAPVDGRAELKRLWTDPDHRGLGVASGLVAAALAHAEQGGIGVVRLSVWKWRVDAIALYGRLGFTVSESWDAREQLVCMERVM